MNKLSKENIKKLKEKGLEIQEFPEGDFFVHKPYGTSGNYLPNKRKRNKIKQDHIKQSDCPAMRVQLKKGVGEVEVWDYTPGPGPGDFTKDFTSEDKMTDFIINYFYEKNPLFQAKIEDDIDHRKAINLKEIKILLEKTITFLDEEFDEEDIELGRISFNKIALEDWHKGHFVEEFSNIKVQHGILSSETFYLKRKRHEGRKIESEDLYRMAHILTELSIRTQRKKSS